MKKYIVIIVLFICFGLESFAQQSNISNMYIQNLFLVNPAATGIQGNVAGSINFKDQWSGLKGAPEVSTFTLHSLINSNMGLGGIVEQNVSGVFKQFTGELNYSYRLLIKENQSISFGLKTGFTQNSLNYLIMEASNPNDPTLLNSSPVVNEAMFRAGAGVHYNMKNLNIHLMSPLLYGQQEKKYFQNNYLLASYDVFAAENIWKIQPSIMFKNTISSKSQLDLNVLAEWDKKVWGVVSYRSNQNILAGFGFFFKGIGLGYSYEVNRSDFSYVSSGSHELMLYFESGFSLSKKEPYYVSSKRYVDRN